MLQSRRRSSTPKSINTSTQRRETTLHSPSDNGFPQVLGSRFGGGRARYRLDLESPKQKDWASMHVILSPTTMGSRNDQEFFREAPVLKDPADILPQIEEIASPMNMYTASNEEFFYRKQTSTPLNKQSFLGRRQTTKFLGLATGLRGKDDQSPNGLAFSEIESESSVQSKMKKILQDPYDKYVPMMLTEPVDGSEVNQIKKPGEEDSQMVEGLLGSEARALYFHHFKNLDRILDKEKCNIRVHSPVSTLLEATRSLDLLPKRCGLIREAGEKTNLDLNNYGLGDRYLPAVAKTIKDTNTLFRRVHMRNNGLSSKAASFLFPNLPTNVTSIDLSRNPIGEKGAFDLAESLKSYTHSLKELHLEDTKIGDKGAMAVLDSLADNNNVLTILNISGNKLSDIVAPKVFTFMKFSDNIRELYLRWNIFSGRGGVILADAITTNSTLHVLDLSWNKLGNYVPCARKFSEIFSSNNKLLHVDLSNNYFNPEESNLIAEGLRDNHSILGFHFSGNCGYVDEKGFLKTMTPMQRPFQMASVIERINGVKCLRKEDKNMRLQNPKFIDNCWICEGWQEVSFEWKPAGPSNAGKLTGLHVLIHFEHEGFRPLEMELVDKVFRLTRLVPRGEIRYFYIIAGNQMIMEDQPKKSNPQPYLKIRFGSKCLDAFIPNLNYKKVDTTAEVVGDDYYVNITTTPREDDPQISLPKKEKLKTNGLIKASNWLFETSLFKDFVHEPESHTLQCFQFDWAMSAMAKSSKSKEEKAKIQALFWKGYKALREAFKFYSSAGTERDGIHVMTLENFKDFALKCGFVDETTYKMSSLEARFLGAKEKPGLMSLGNLQQTVIDLTEGATKHPEASEITLCRHEFLETLFFIAIEKYGKVRTMNNIDALDKLLTEFVLPHCMEFNPHYWREENLWKETMEHVFKSFLPVLNELFKKYTTQKPLKYLQPQVPVRVRKGKKKASEKDLERDREDFVQLHEEIEARTKDVRLPLKPRKAISFRELMQMCRDAHLFSESSLTEPAIKLAFLFSGMVNQVDERHQKRQSQLNFLEFLEFIARIAERYAALPPGQILTFGQVISQEDWMDKRMGQPLHLKLESLIHTFYHRCLDETQRAAISLPNESLFAEVQGDITPLAIAIVPRPANIETNLDHYAQQTASQAPTLRRILSKGSIQIDN